MRKLLPLLLLAIFLIAPRADAQTITEDLTVTTIERNPFVRMDGDKLEGFSIELWREIAADRGWTYNFTVVDSFVDLLRPVRQDTTDLAIANISITADREEVMDFSSSIFRSGLQIMIPQRHSAAHIRQAVQDPVALAIIASLVAVLVVLAHILWTTEKDRSNKIAKSYIRGLSDAIWWTLTLGGFGRNLPQTIWGRLSLLSWMGSVTIGAILIAAQLTSSFTTHAISSHVTSPQDLQGKKVGTTAGSTSETYMRTRNITTIPYDNIETMFADISNGKLDAVIHDAPLLQYYAANTGKDTVLLAGELFNAEDYGIALPPGSPLREDINSALLRFYEDGTYDRLYTKWFGSN